jgi:hypothetical protein
MTVRDRLSTRFLVDRGSRNDVLGLLAGAVFATLSGGGDEADDRNDDSRDDTGNEATHDRLLST